MLHKISRAILLQECLNEVLGINTLFLCVPVIILASLLVFHILRSRLAVEGIIQSYIYLICVWSIFVILCGHRYWVVSDLGYWIVFDSLIVIAVCSLFQVLITFYCLEFLEKVSKNVICIGLTILVYIPLSCAVCTFIVFHVGESIS